MLPAKEFLGGAGGAGGGRTRGATGAEEGALTGAEGGVALGAKDQNGEADFAAQEGELAEEAPGLVVGGGEVDGHEGGEALVGRGVAGEFAEREQVGADEGDDFKAEAEIGGAATGDFDEGVGGAGAGADEQRDGGFHGGRSEVEDEGEQAEDGQGEDDGEDEFGVAGEALGGCEHGGEERKGYISAHWRRRL